MNIAFLSLGSGGTMGHMSLTTQLSSVLSEKHKVFLFSDHDYSDFSNVKKPRFKFLRISSQKHQKTVGGKLNYKYKEELFLKLRKNKIQVLIFSTFFDTNILDYCKNNKIKTILISYPLRDSHREAIKLRKYYEDFDRVFTLKDIFPIKKVSKKEEIVSPVKLSSKEINNPKEIKNILITCGGGGRLSSKIFLKIVSKITRLIHKKYPKIRFTIITGNSNFRIKLPNSEIIKWSKNFLELLAKSDLVISEAGYYTLFDLITLNKPAILIPGERRIDNQELRAIKFQEKGLGWVIFPSEESTDLSNLIEFLIKNPKSLDNKKKSFNKVQEEIFSKVSLNKKIIEEIE